jgi:hypothetical protein
MDANSFGTQSHSCEAINGAALRAFKGCGFIRALILLQPAPGLAAVKQPSALSVLERLVALV